MKHKRKLVIYHLIQRLKDGCEILTTFRGASVSQFNIMAGILGAIMGGASLYMALQNGNMDHFLVPRAAKPRDSSEILYYVAGLQNLGNSCFLNVILQALASCGCFLSFCQDILVDDNPLIEKEAEKMPLAVALTSLLKELSIVHEEKTVLNPRKVMLAMDFYMSNFNLAGQQDAAEALIHLLSSLEEEISKCYVPPGSSLAVVTAFPSRIYKLEKEGQSEYERWKQQLFGPFDGTIRSILTCRSCLSTVSVDFEHFRCLPLTPVLGRGAYIVGGRTLVDCLKKFTSMELIENYRCRRCWHISALKYLSLKEEKDEAKIKMLDNCVRLDSCDCENLFRKEEITWNGFSHALKQLTIARCPKILCIHLQRALMNRFGESIKFQGHISFPLLLDIFPYVRAATMVGQSSSGKNYGVLTQGREQQQPLFSHLCHFNMPSDMQKKPHLFGVVGENYSFEAFSMAKLGGSVFECSGDTLFETVAKGNDDDGDKPAMFAGGMIASDFGCPEASSIHEPGFAKEVTVSGSSGSSKSYMYCLSSVAVHYGESGGGHYALYRRVPLVSGDGVSVGPVGTLNRQWVYVSDHEVSNVPEETVLAAEASLLFYEKIELSL